MPEFIIDTLMDIVKSLPILFLVYLIIEWLEKRLSAKMLLKYNDRLMGPPMGALVGCIPQCGFSAASATLYHSGVIGAGTLIAVFLSTSDEALPILLSHGKDYQVILLLMGCKLVIAMLAGYLFQRTVFRHEMLSVKRDPVALIDCDEHCHEQHRSAFWISVFRHTLKTALYIAVTLIIINTAIHFIGEVRLQSLLLTESAVQPLLTGLIGLIPGCATSVLLTELFLSNSISFGAAVAGLCSGAGFGFLILFGQRKKLKNNLKILGCTYLVGTVAGMVLHLAL